MFLSSFFKKELPTWHRMKQLSTLFFCICLFSGLAAQNLPSYLPANGLVGWWPFNGNANDESGNGNHGTVNGATLTADRFGNAGKAYDFSNPTDLIEINRTQKNINAYSVIGWFKKSNGSSGGTFFVGSRFPTNDYGLLLGLDNDLLLAFGAENGPNSVWTYSSGSEFVDNKWHLFCAIFNSTEGSIIDTSNLTIFIDNIPLIKEQRVWGNQANVISPVNNNINTIIGNYTYNQNGSFKGILDDIAIYNRALTQQEITALYQAGNSTALQYQLQQQKEGNCPTSPVRLSVKTQPRLFTDSVGSINATTAMVYGSIPNDGGQDISSRGICWSTSPNPTTDLITKTQNGSGMGSFSGNLSSLSPSTTYYTRAYSTSAAGTWYGNELTFTTSASVSSATCGAPNIHNPNLSYGSMTDQDGNSYKTIVIGSQEWMAENLKTGHYRNGEMIPIVTNDTGWTEPASCWFKNDSANYSCPYGRYYNWYAVADPRGICPIGWHLPSDEDWKILEQYLGMPERDLDKFRLEFFVARGDSQNIGGKLQSNGSNESGFSALLGGFRSGDQFLSGPDSYPLGFWWTALDFEINAACIRLLTSDPPPFLGVTRMMRFGKSFGLSTRCVKDNLQNGIFNFEKPDNTGTIYSGQSISDAHTKIIYTGGNGENYAGQEVASTGVTGLTASLAEGQFGHGNGTLTIQIVGTPSSPGKAVFTLNLNGQLLTFSRMVVASGGGLTDIDGNNYESVIVGNQEWMKENLKVSRYRNGDALPELSDGAEWQNTTDGAFTYFDNNPANNSTIGKLYNWYAVSDSRKLCPTDWHEPSDEDWTNLENYLGGVRFAGGKMKSTGTTESGTGLWRYPNFGGTNESGFTVIPGVQCIYSEDNGFWDYLFSCSAFWSSAENSSDNAIYRYLRNNSADSARKSADKNSGFSVRCLKD
jgi:uncharacterized protein (TIGR02145 family)